MEKETLLKLKEQLEKEKEHRKILELMPKDTIYSYLVKCNSDHLEDIAINYLGNQISFEKLFDKIDLCASSLINAGVKPGDYVCLSPLTTPEGIISFYAINKIGAIAHFINPSMSKGEITKHIKETNSKVFITMDLFYSEEMKKAFDEGGIRLSIITSLIDSLPFGLNSDSVKYNLITAYKLHKSAVKNSKNAINWKTFMESGVLLYENYTHPFVPNSPAAVAYTSGSTGESKGVVATNEAFNAIPVLMGLSEGSIQRQDGIFNSLPLWIYYSLGNNTHEPLCLGVTLELDPLLDVKRLDKRFKMYKFNHWNTVPHYVDLAFKGDRIKKVDFSRVKTITTGGDFLLEEVKRRADEIIKMGNGTVRVGEGYGTSEVIGCFSFQSNKSYVEGSCGKPLVGNQMMILNPENLEKVNSGESGELYIWSPTMMSGYLNNEEKNNEVFYQDASGQTWLKTGDLAHENEYGELVPDGRIRRIVMTLDENGFPTKIIPEKLKLVVSNHEYVEKVEAITVEDPEVITKAVLFVKLNPGVNESEEVLESIRIYCEENLPSYMVPSPIIVVDEIPLKPSLKPDFDELEKIYHEYKTKSLSRVRSILKSKKM